MTMRFMGTAHWVLRVTMWNPAPFTEALTGEVRELSKPADQTDQEFLADFAAFHGLVMAQSKEFFTIGGHRIKPYFVERIELIATYVDPDEKRF